MTSRPHMQFFCMIQKLRTMVEVMPHSWLGASHGIGLPLFCHVSRWPRERGHQAVGLCLFVARSLRCQALE